MMITMSFETFAGNYVSRISFDEQKERLTLANKEISRLLAERADLVRRIRVLELTLMEIAALADKAVDNLENSGDFA